MKLTARCVTLVAVMSLARGQGDLCTSSSGVSGRCVTLNACDKLKSVIWGSSLSQEVFKQWQCGLEERKPMVCCPINAIATPGSVNVTSSNAIDTIITTTVITTTTATTATGSTTSTTTTTTTTSKASPSANKCLTLEGNFGTCVKLSSCQNLAEKLKNPTEENLDYVFKSRCIGSAAYSVCCEESQRNKSDTISSSGHPSHPHSTWERNKHKEEVFEKHLINKFKNACTPSANLPDPNGGCCGIEARTESKTNGGEASIYQYPWLAIIEYRYDNNMQCVGSLVTSLHVLTVARCLPKNKSDRLRNIKSVRLGDYNVTNDGPDCVELDGGGRECTLGAISIPVASTTVHPYHNKEKNIYFANDIGLITLSEMAPYNEFIRPICLPNLDINKSPPRELKFFVAGWGAADIISFQNNIKLHVDLPYYDMTRCLKYFEETEKESIWDKQICAGGELNVGTCKGDSGVPLMYFDGLKFEISGINSFGYSQCGMEDVPEVFTNVYTYMSWIKSVIES